MDARGNPTPGDTQQDPSTGAWTMYNGGSFIQVADGYDVSSMDYDPATGNVFDGKQWFGGGVPGYGSGDGSGYQASEGQESPTPEASQAPATPTPEASQAPADQSVPATGPSDAPYGGSTNLDSAGKVMELGDAGSVDPVNGQVWNGRNWYNDPAVQVDPSTPVGAPVSYYVPDSFQWNGTSYVAEGNPGGTGQQPGQGGNQEGGNQQQQQRAGNQGGRQYAAPGQQSPDGTWGPQVANEAGPFAGAVANPGSPQRPVQQQVPQQQSWQPPQPTGPQQSYPSQSAGAAGAQQQQQQQQVPQQQTSPQQTSGPQVGPHKTSPQKTAAAQAGTKSSPPAKSNKGLLLFGVVAGLAVVTGIAVWASRPKTPVDPKVAKRPAHGQEHPAHVHGAA